MTSTDTQRDAAAEGDDLAAVLPELWNLLGEYARLVDNRQAAEFSRLFGTRGVMVLPDREVSGEAGLTEFAANSPRGVHVQGVPTVQRRPDGTLVASSNFIFINAVTYNLSSGEYRDEVRAEDGRLVFARRVIVSRVKTAEEPPTE